MYIKSQLYVVSTGSKEIERDKKKQRATNEKKLPMSRADVSVEVPVPDCGII